MGALIDTLIGYTDFIIVLYTIVYLIETVIVNFELL